MSAWDLRLDISPQNQLIHFMFERFIIIIFLNIHEKVEVLATVWSGRPGLSALSSFCLSADRLVSAGLCTSGDMSGSDAAKPVATNESLFPVQSH